MDLSTEFERLMGALEDWYADDMRAIDYSGRSGGHTSDGGHRILRVAPYPGPPWRREFAHARAAGNVAAQEAINRALRDELYGLDHGPSQSSPASGLVRGTLEWKRAVGQADGSLRAVARRFGISHTEVRRIRLDAAQRGDAAAQGRGR